MSYFFLLYFNQRPRTSYFFYFTSIRGLGRATFFILPQSEASDELLFLPKRLSEPLRYAEKEKQRKGDGYINLIVTFAV